MQDAETEVHAAELVTFHLTVPKSGPPVKGSEVQGTPMLSWELTPSAADQLERSVRKMSHDVRRGRPMLYRGGRLLLPDRPEADEERDMVARATTGEDSEAVTEVVGLRGLRRELQVELQIKRLDLDRVEQAIEAAKRRLVEEEARQEARLKAVVDRYQKLVTDAQDHHEARLRKVWEMERDIERNTTNSLEQLGVGVNLATEAKRQINSILRAQTTGEMLSSIKGTLEVALNSPMGQAGQTIIAARLASAVSTRMGQKVEPDDAMAAIIMQGKQFRERVSMLHEMEQVTPAGNCRAKGLVLGVTFVLGTVPPEVVAKFIAAGNP